MVGVGDRIEGIEVGLASCSGEFVVGAKLGGSSEECVLSVGSDNNLKRGCMLEFSCKLFVVRF